MSVRLPFLLVGLVLALAAYLGVVWLQRDARNQQIGLSTAPCTQERKVVTGWGGDDWAGRCAHRAANARLLQSGERPEIVMIGDSLTMGWPVMEGVTDRGIGLQSSDQLVVRFHDDVVQLRPRIVHILVGINDVAGVTGPFTLAQYRGNLTTMITLARANGMRVILGTIPSAGRFPNNPAVDPRPAVRAMNAEIKALAKQHGLVLADYNAVMSRADGSIRPDLYIDDTVHPNPAGYAAMQPVFDKALAEARASLQADVSESR